MQAPEKTTKTLLAFIVFAAIFLDYWTYSQQFYREPAVYTDVILGTAAAPNQYRVGAVRVASFLARHGHMGLRHGMAVLDGLSALLAVYLLYSLLCRSAAYLTAGNLMRWFASASFLVLVPFYLIWLTWYQRPETLPTSALVALALWLLTGRSAPSGPLAAIARAAGLLLFSGAQGLVRADVAVALNLGVLLVCFTRLSVDLSLPRAALAATSLLGIALSGGIQFYLMRVAYPHASYGANPVFQLVLNITDRLRIVPFLIFLLPWAWTIQYLVRRRCTPPGPSAALLFGSVVFLVLWCVLGKIDEVRIFFPFALCLAPLTVLAIMHKASQTS
jgi:hypothetical protein